MATTITPMIEAHLDQLSTVSYEQTAPGHAAYLRSLKAGGFEPRVVYDIGACVLHWTRFAKTLWPDARYILFDAHDKAEFMYKRGGYDYHMGVLSDTDGREVDFYQNDTCPTGSGYYREIGCGPLSTTLFPEGSGRRELAQSVDGVAGRRGFPPPDLVKIDAQGSESDILHGATRTFAETRHMIVEMQHTAYNVGAPDVSVTMLYITGELGWTLVGRIELCPSDADYAFERPVK